MKITQTQFNALPEEEKKFYVEKSQPIAMDYKKALDIISILEK
jgi:hypothetical protein